MKTLNILVVISVMLILGIISCNPLTNSVAKKVELWICVAPTIHCMLYVSEKKISTDTLDKYFDVDVDGDKYKIRLDTLTITQSGSKVCVDIVFKNIKYKETFLVLNKEVPYICKADILIFLKIVD